MLTYLQGCCSMDRRELTPTSIVPIDAWARVSVLKIASALVFYAAIIGGNRIAELINQVRE